MGSRLLRYNKNSRKERLIFDTNEKTQQTRWARARMREVPPRTSSRCTRTASSSWTTTRMANLTKMTSVVLLTTLVSSCLRESSMAFWARSEVPAPTTTWSRCSRRRWPVMATTLMTSLSRLSRPRMLSASLLPSRKNPRLKGPHLSLRRQHLQMGMKEMLRRRRRRRRPPSKWLFQYLYDASVCAEVTLIELNNCPPCVGKAEAKTEADISATIRYIPESSIWALKIKRVIFNLLYFSNSNQALRGNCHTGTN